LRGSGWVGNVTEEMMSFMECLFPPFSPYIDPLGSLFPRKISTGFINTPGATEEMAKELGCGTCPAQIFLNNLALELVAERSAVFHGKILFPLLGNLGSCPVL